MTLALPAGTDEVRVRYAPPADVLAECEAVYAALVPRRPGMLARQPGWERAALVDPESEREGASALQCVVAERDGGVTGYARFRTKMGWGPSGHDGTVTVEDLAALDPATEAALWRFLFGIDLMTTLKVRGRPVDDAWQHLVSDIRRCPAAAAGRRVRAARGRGCGPVGPYVSDAPRRRVRGRGRLLPLERGALAADGRREGRVLRAYGGRGGPSP